MADTVVTIMGAAAVAYRTAAFAPLPLFLPAGVAFRTAAFGALVAAPSGDDTDRGTNRILTGLPGVALDGPLRGTHGLMPAAWGRVVSFDIDDTGVDFEVRHTGGKLIAAGQTSGRLNLAMSLRLPASATLPARGDTFLHPWRGSDRLFVVWSVSPVWTIRGLRMLDVSARHELDLGNKAPTSIPAPSYPNI